MKTIQRQVLYKSIQFCLIASPLYIWMIVTILYIGGILPPTLYTILTYLLGGLIIINVLFLPCKIQVLLMKENHVEIQIIKKISKEDIFASLLCGLPLLFTVLLFQMKGLIIYVIIQLLFLIYTKQHHTLNDILYFYFCSNTSKLVSVPCQKEQVIL